jgi:hypothetical protein
MVEQMIHDRSDNTNKSFPAGGRDGWVSHYILSLLKQESLRGLLAFDDLFSLSSKGMSISARGVRKKGNGFDVHGPGSSISAAGAKCQMIQAPEELPVP